MAEIASVNGSAEFGEDVHRDARLAPERLAREAELS